MPKITNKRKVTKKIEVAKLPEIVVIDHEIMTPAVKKFETRLIESPEEMEEATAELSRLNIILDRLTEDKERLTKPANILIAEIRSRYKPAEAKLKPLIDMFRSKISAYQTIQNRLAREEQERIAKELAEGKVGLEDAGEQFGAVALPVAKVATAMGLVSFREDKRLKITDEQQIRALVLTKNDWTYFVINEDKLLEDLKAGKLVAGAEIEIISVPINRRA